LQHSTPSSFAIVRNIRFSSFDHARVHFQLVRTFSSQNSETDSISPDLAGAYYFILSRGDRWLADVWRDLSRMPKFGSRKARSGRAAGELARVCPDRASSLTGPRIVRTLWPYQCARALLLYALYPRVSTGWTD